MHWCLLIFLNSSTPQSHMYIWIYWSVSLCPYFLLVSFLTLLDRFPFPSSWGDCLLHLVVVYTSPPRLSCHAAANVLSYQFPFSLYEDNKVSALQPPSRTVRWWGSTDLLVIDRRRSLQDDILRPIIPYQYLMFVARSMDFKCCYLYPSFSPIFVSQLPKPFQEQLALVLILYWRWRHEVG
jgi:hypothetical protein